MASVTQLHPSEISPEEWEIRCDLAALYRAFVRYGWTDLIYTHITARVPGEDGHFLINPYGLSWGDDLEELTVRYGAEKAWEREQQPPDGFLTDTRNIVGRHHPKSQEFLPPKFVLQNKQLSLHSFHNSKDIIIGLFPIFVFFK